MSLSVRRDEPFTPYQKETIIRNILITISVIGSVLGIMAGIFGIVTAVNKNNEAKDIRRAESIVKCEKLGGIILSDFCVKIISGAETVKKS